MGLDSIDGVKDVFLEQTFKLSWSQVGKGLKSIRDKFPSLFENVVLGSLKSFFQLDNQVDINLYLIEATALRHSSWFETVMMLY